MYAAVLLLHSLLRWGVLLAAAWATLAAAAGGEGSAALHEVLVSLLTPGAPDLSLRLEALDARREEDLAGER